LIFFEKFALIISYYFLDEKINLCFKYKIEMGYGKHLLVEVIVKDSAPLTKISHLRKFFAEIVKQLHFTVIAKPFFYKFPSKDGYHEGGITGFCIVGESHIAIHTWPEANYFAFDIFSCRNFDEKVSLRIIKNHFLTKHIYSEIIERGIKINFHDAHI